MQVGLPFRFIATALLGLTLGSVVARAQIILNGPTRVSNGAGGYTYPTWKPMMGTAGNAQTGADGYLYETTLDQQTGQADADYVSNAPIVTNGTVTTAGAPGFFIQYGTINGVDHIAFRVIMNAVQSGNTLNLRLGMDGNADGKIDLFMGASISGGVGQTISFQTPGTGLNISPNTSSWGNDFYPTARNAAVVTATSSATVIASGNNAGIAARTTGAYINFNTTSLTTNSAAYPGWVQQSTQADSMVSFAIPVADLNAALASLSPNPNITVTSSLLMRWVAVTSTQSNSVNQDAYGLGPLSGTTGDTTYASFAQLMDATGKPVPEPATYGLFLGAGLAGLLFLRRRRATAPLAA